MNPFKTLYRSLNRITMSGRIRVVLLAVITVLLVAGVPRMGKVIWGQETKGNNKIEQSEKKAGEKTVNETSPEETKKDETNTSHLAEAGKFSVTNFDPTVWVMICLFLFAIAVTIERVFYLIKHRGNNAELIDVLMSGLSESSEDPTGLIKKIQDKKYGMEGRIAAKTLQGWNFGVPAMHEFANAGMEAEKRGLDKRLVVLSTLGNNTPFIGLLGTVLGIMKAFRDLAMIGDAGPAVVMKGISEALIATAFGLGVAIPCVIAFNVLSKRVQAKLSNAEEVVKILSGIRSAFARSGAQGVKNYTDDVKKIDIDDGSAPVAGGELAGEMA